MSGKVMKTFNVVRRLVSAVVQPQTKKSFVLARTAFSISLLVIVALLAACSSTTPTATSAPQQTAASDTPNPTVTSSPTDTPAPTVAISPTAAPAETGTPQQTAAPTVLDPCQLLPSQEASSLAGDSFGAGTEGTIPGGGNTCTYGSLSTNILFVQVVKAPDTATADAAIIGGVSINAGGETFNGSVIGFRKGTIFFGFSDVVLGSAAPTNAAMQAEATTVLGRLP